MTKVALIILLVLSVATLSACDVEKQMDTMVDNPSFADPLFSKFMARSEYQVKAMDTILTDPAMRQVLLEKIAAEPEYATALAEQMVAYPETRALLSQMLGESPAGTAAP